MTSTLLDADAEVALALLEAAVDAVLAADLGRLADEQVLELTRRAEVQRRRLAAVDARLVGEVDARGLAASHGARDTATLLSLMLRVDPAEAKARVAAGRDLTSRRTMTGAQLQPALPHVAAALREGQIHPRHATIISRTVDALPVDVQATMDRQIECELVDEAKRFAPYQLARIAERLRYLYDQDGTLSDDADRTRRRRFDYRRHADGSMSGEFHFDPPTAEIAETVLDSQLANLTAEQRGTRTPAQLRHDALRDLMTMLLRSGQLPTTAGVTTTVVVTVTLPQWAALLTLAGIAAGPVASASASASAPPSAPPTAPPTAPPSAPPTAPEPEAANTERHRRRQRPPGEWLAVTSHGAFLTLSEVAPLLGDAQVMTAVLSSLGTPRKVDAYGDKQRIFTENQRLAMAARDRGCTFPGCTSAPAYCEAHHVVPNADGGPTSVANGALLCAYHHRTFDDLGYTCVMVDGVPHWIAPEWIDPTRTPQRNTAHDPGHPDG